jgi:hypothetical protein
VPTKPETLFYRRVNKPLPRDMHFQKFGAAAENGTPDFWYSGNKADMWVEYKWVAKVPLTGVDPAKLMTALQRKWANDRSREGRSVVIIVGSPQGCAILTDGAWNVRVPMEDFRYADSAVSAFLTEKLHDFSAISGQSGSCDKFDVSYFNDDDVDRRGGV